jgi:hypothetical protein
MNSKGVGFRWQVANMTQEDFVTDGRTAHKLIFDGGRVGITYDPIPCERLGKGEVSDIGYAQCYTDRTSGDYTIFFSPPFGGPNEKNIAVNIPVNSLTPCCLMTIVVCGSQETDYRESCIRISSPYGDIAGMVNS